MKLKPFEIRTALPAQGSGNGLPFPQSSGLGSGAANSSARAPVAAAGLQSLRSEPTIRRWIEELDEAVVVLDSGIIVETNHRAPALFGRSAGAILGLHVKELVSNESLIRLAHFLEFDDPEPAVVLGLRQDDGTLPLHMKAIAAIICGGRRLRVTSLTRCGAVQKAVGTTPAG
jgi:hypothetical protein